MASRKELGVALGLAVAIAVLLVALAVLKATIPRTPSTQSIGHCRDGETPATHPCYKPA